MTLTLPNRLLAESLGLGRPAIPASSEFVELLPPKSSNSRPRSRVSAPIRGCLAASGPCWPMSATCSPMSRNTGKQISCVGHLFSKCRQWLANVSSHLAHHCRYRLFPHLGQLVTNPGKVSFCSAQSCKSIQVGQMFAKLGQAWPAHGQDSAKLGRILASGATFK